MKNQTEDGFAFIGPASDEGLATCRGQLETNPLYQGLPARLRFAADLALDELATNTIKYGDSAGAPFEFVIRRENGSLIIEYRDHGVPFNPWEHGGTTQETLDSIEDTLIGGRGIVMLRELSAARHYERRDESNVVTLTVIEESGSQ